MFEKETPEKCNIYFLETDVIRNILFHLNILGISIVNIELNNNSFNDTILCCAKRQEKKPMTEASRNRNYQRKV